MSQTEIKQIVAPTFRWNIFVGARIASTAMIVALEQSQLEAALQEFLQKTGSQSSFNISPVRFLRDGYTEDGFRIETVNYPTRPTSVTSLAEETTALAKALLVRLRQERICVVTPTATIVFQQQLNGEEAIGASN